MNKHYSHVLFALFLLAGVTTVAGASPKPSTVSTLYPIYVPTSLEGVSVACGGGTFILSFDYFPEPGDTTYELHMMADGGSYGGSVSLALPWGYEDSAYVPALSGTNPYTVTVVTPPYTGINPLRIEVFGTGDNCTPSRADKNAAVTPLLVHALNIKAGH